MKILGLIIKILLFVLLLVLAANNMQSVEFNFLGIYIIKLPLIIVIAIFTLLGLLLGLIIGWFKRLGLNHKINQLNNELSQVTTKNT